MLTVGLTGGFQTGKTTVLSMFEKCGARVLSADALVHNHLQKNKTLHRKIKRLFGESVFKNGQVNRHLLADRVFPHLKGLKKLNQIIHPYVKRDIFDFLERCYKRYEKSVVVVEVPLLFETGFEKFFDVTVVVFTKPKVAGERMIAHSGFTIEDMNMRMRRQFSLAQKMARCDFIIDNNAGLERTFYQVREFMEFLEPFRETGIPQFKRKFNPLA